MLKCSKEECDHLATAAPRICIPAQGHAILPGKQCTIVVGMQLCDAHLAAFDKELILQDGLKASFRQRFAEIGRAPPDFERAFVVACPLDHADFTRLHERKVEREKTQSVSNKKPDGL